MLYRSVMTLLTLPLEAVLELVVSRLLSAHYRSHHQQWFVRSILRPLQAHTREGTPDLVRWADSLSGRKVKLVLGGREVGEYEVEAGVPQGSPVAPILSTAYLSKVFEYV